MVSRRWPGEAVGVALGEDDASELPLKSYATLATTDLLAKGIVARMLAGIQTQRHPIALEPSATRSNGRVHGATLTGTHDHAEDVRSVVELGERLPWWCIVGQAVAAWAMCDSSGW